MGDMSGEEAALTIDAAVEVLNEGDIEIEGRMPWSSNGTYLVTVAHDETTVGGVYKPLSGERPLWDFPPGLHRREVAAFELAMELGWPIIPPTVLRDGPMGEGSVQLFINADFEQHHFTLVEDRVHHDQLRQMALFDVIANNTDRKSGHCLVDSGGNIWGIDNGLCFSVDFKLRTVIWDFAGQRIPKSWLVCVQHVASGGAAGRLDGLLTGREIDAVARRAGQLVEFGHFPEDQHGHRWPWPLV
jgi:uncharacterized repeat protein (TIGR03843 family)